MNDTNDILAELRKPFHPANVTWKPGSVTKDQTKAKAMAYADLRAYQNRLDEVAGLDWSCTYTPWGERIVCHLTIKGVTRSSSGEPDSQSERSEIAGTAAEAQAFKRACAMFGLGRYLYELPSAWVEYDANAKQFTDKAKAKLEGIIVNHYRRWLNAQDEQTKAKAEQQPPQAEQVGEGDDVAKLREQFNQLGEELYGEQWEQVNRHNVERITNGAVSDSGALNAEQIQKLVDGMRKLQARRQAAAQNGTAGK